MGVHCCCLRVKHIVYKRFDRFLHVGSLDPTCVQNFSPVPLTVFEIQVKNENKKKNWKNAIFPMFAVQFSPHFR